MLLKPGMPAGTIAGAKSAAGNAADWPKMVARAETETKTTEYLMVAVVGVCVVGCGGVGVGVGVGVVWCDWPGSECVVVFGDFDRLV